MAVGAHEKANAKSHAARSLRVRVVRPTAADGQPIGSHDARRLLKAVIKYRPFACDSHEAERAAWKEISDALLGGEASSPAFDVEERFWYLLDVFDRHRTHGLALAGLSKGVVEQLETIVLCIKTYGYMRQDAVYAAPACGTTEDADDTETETVAASVPEQPSEEASIERAMDKAFRGLSEMKILLTQSQRECADKATQLASVVETNEQLQRENEQLCQQVASLQAELDETQQTVSKIKTERHSRDGEAATRKQRIRDTMKSLVTMLDAGET